MLTENHTMESLSRAYVQAIAGVAGLNLKLEHNAHEFDYGVDGTFYSIKKFRGGFVESGFALDFQLKASTNWKCDTTHVIYEMNAQAYNKIVDRNNQKRAIPKILILLCLPKKSIEWLENTEDQLLLRKCCYWARLLGDITNNASSATIRIPRGQQLRTASLLQLLESVERGVWS